MAQSWRGRIGSGALLLLLGVVMFDVPVAYAIVRGAPSWLAFAIGLAVFPVLPVTWHVLRERSRRAAKAEVKPGAPVKPSKTTGWERYTFRMLVVGVLVIGALTALDRSRVWRGVRHHALWMIPTTIEPLVPDSKLLDRVPASAELILWLRDTSDAQAMVSEIAPTSFNTGEVVLAFDAKEAMILESGDAKLIDLILPFYWMIAPGKTAPKVVELPGGIRMWSTGHWPASTGRARALIELMRRAPDTAFLVAAAKPRAVKKDEVSNAVGWVSLDQGMLEAVGVVTATSPNAAQTLLGEAERELAKERMAKPAAFLCGSASGGTITLDATGNVFVARAKIAVDQVRPLVLCLD